MLGSIDSSDVGGPLNILKLVKDLPNPQRTIMVWYLVLAGVCFVGMVVAAFYGGAGRATLISWISPGIGFLAFAFGLILATNYRGSAQVYASMFKSLRIGPIEYSATPFSTAKFLRIFGAVFSAMAALVTLLTLTN